MNRVIGVFNSYEEATKAVNDLKARGIPDDKISLITRGRDDKGIITDENYVVDGSGNEVADATAAGATTGGILGGLAGVLAGIGALAIPGVGPIIAAGPIVAGLTGAAAGATGGGLLGALVGLGLEEDDAKVYNTELSNGGVIVTVEDDGNYLNDINNIYSNYNSTNYKTWNY